MIRIFILQTFILMAANTSFAQDKKKWSTYPNSINYQKSTPRPVSFDIDIPDGIEGMSLKTVPPSYDKTSDKKVQVFDYIDRDMSLVGELPMGTAIEVVSVTGYRGINYYEIKKPSAFSSTNAEKANNKMNTMWISGHFVGQ